MIAALPMYDLPELRAETDRLWEAIRAHLATAGIAAPVTLDRGMDELMPHWHLSDLLLSQTCGLPYRAHLHGAVTLVGTPDYGLPDCPPGHYRSVFVARADDPRATLADFDGAVFAWNDGGSQSGWAAPVAHLAAAGIGFRLGPQTGGHRASVEAVAAGRADFAAIDAVTFALLCDHLPAAAALKLVDRTAPGPGLPLITAAGPGSQARAAALFSAFAAAVAALSPADAQALHLRGIVHIPPETYLAQPLPPNPQAFAVKNPA